MLWYVKSMTGCFPSALTLKESHQQHKRVNLTNELLPMRLCSRLHLITRCGRTRLQAGQGWEVWRGEGWTGRGSRVDEEGTEWDEGDGRKAQWVE